MASTSEDFPRLSLRLVLRGESIYLPSRMLNERSRKAFTSRCRLSADVYEIPRIAVIFAKNFLLCVMQERQKLVEEALLALIR